MITDQDRINFSQDHILISAWQSAGWHAINKHNGETVSPTYSDPEAVINFVVNLLYEEADKAIEDVLSTQE